MPSPLGKVPPKRADEVYDFGTKSYPRSGSKGANSPWCKQNHDMVLHLIRPRFPRPPSPEGKAFGLPISIYRAVTNRAVQGSGFTAQWACELTAAARRQISICGAGCQAGLFRFAAVMNRYAFFTTPFIIETHRESITDPVSSFDP